MKARTLRTLTALCAVLFIGMMTGCGTNPASPELNPQNQANGYNTSCPLDDENHWD